MARWLRHPIYVRPASNGRDFFCLPHRSNVRVPPGTELAAEIVGNGKSYTMSIRRLDTNATVSYNLTVQTVPSDGPFVNVYFVLEHQPFFCDELPATNKLSYFDIEIEWGGKRLPSPNWSTHVKKPKCHSNVTVLSPSQISINWDARSSNNE